MFFLNVRTKAYEFILKNSQHQKRITPCGDNRCLNKNFNYICFFLFGYISICQFYLKKRRAAIMFAYSFRDWMSILFTKNPFVSDIFLRKETFCMFDL